MEKFFLKFLPVPNFSWVLTNASKAIYFINYKGKKDGESKLRSVTSVYKGIMFMSSIWT